MSSRGRKRFRGKARSKEDMVLQITSMADIFTIILVFLLKTFSTGVSNITPNKNLVLPEAHASEVEREMLKLEITQDGVLIDDKAVTALEKFAFKQTDLERDGTPRSLNAALIVELEKEKGRNPSSTTEPGQPADPNAVNPPSMMVLADQKTPYHTLRTVMTAAANAGFANFKLVVVEDR